MRACWRGQLSPGERLGGNLIQLHISEIAMDIFYIAFWNISIFHKILDLEGQSAIYFNILLEELMFMLNKLSLCSLHSSGDFALPNVLSSTSHGKSQFAQNIEKDSKNF